MALQLTPKQYLTKIKMSNRPTLLVEGRDDQRFFRLLLDAHRTHHFSPDSRSRDLLIDTAEMISSVNGIGNRQKVELVSRLIEGQGDENRYLGFVDREFRGFTISHTIEDRLRTHNELGRLIWSRGHSIENYFLEFGILREPLRDFSVSDYFDTALDCLERIFPQVILLAAALGLAGKDTSLLSVVGGSVSYEHLKIQNGILTLDSSFWRQSLQTRQNLDVVRTSELVDAYEHWLQVLTATDPIVARWLCHGHTCLRLIWVAYGKCIHDACEKGGAPQPVREAQRVLRADESVRFNACAGAWARHVFANGVESPWPYVEQLIPSP